MPFQENIEKALARATDYYWNAWNEKPSIADAFSHLSSNAYPQTPSAFDKDCCGGMEILLTHCGSKFSEKYIRKQLPVFYNLVDPTTELSKPEISEMLHAVYQKYIDWQEETTICFPVECIVVDGDEAVSFGQVSFWNFEVLLKKKHGVFLDEWLKNTPKNYIPQTVASFSMIADIQKTNDTGKPIINDVLNVIQYVKPLFVVQKQTPHYSLSEIYPRRHAVTFRLQDDTLNVYSMYRTDSAVELHLPLCGNSKKRWDEALGNEAIAVMQSNGTNKIAEMLRQAIYWHAAGEREASYERALIYYTMALESIFTTLGSNVSTNATIADSLALLLGNDVKDRLEIKKKAKALYQQRSSLAHGKKNVVKHSDLEIQRGFSYSAIYFVLSKRNEFQKQEDIAQHFEDLKFTLPRDVKYANTPEAKEDNV